MTRALIPAGLGTVTRPALLLAAMAGCGGGSPMNGPGDGAVFLGCLNAVADSYTAGMSKTGKDGVYSVQLMTSDPAPPVKGDNLWVITIKDAAGNPVEGATIKATPFMPVHQHGTSKKAVVTALPEGGYSITPLNFFMAGVWETTLDVTPAGATSSADSVVFRFCVDG